MMFRPAPVALALAALAGCTLDWDDISQAGMNLPPLPPGSTGSTGDEPTPTTSGSGDSSTTTTTAAHTTGAADETSGTDTGDSTSNGGPSDASSSGTGEDVLPPKVLAVDMPAKVTVAGPVPFTATTEHAASAHAKLDGVDVGPLTHDGGGVYSGVVKIYGSVDAGAHVLEVVAESGDLSHAYPFEFDVGTPAPGSPAWTMSGPTGSRTRRIAVTPEGDVLEVGTWETGGVARPAIRKRSGVTGAELWPGGTLVLDDRQGDAVDVAVAPDGRLWVAMNVREGLNKWRPRIVLLDAAGQPTGVEMPTEAGHTVAGIDSDGAGGFFADGFAATGFGDTDVVVWRMTDEFVPVLSGKMWDYVPSPNDDPPHKYSDIATDVVVQDGVAWIVGFSNGKHDMKNELRTRGLIVRMDIDTGAVLGPVIIAPASVMWTQSMLYGAAAHPDGVIVTGTGCNDACDMQRVETALYTPAGARPWFRPEPSAAIARGNAVDVGEHDVVIIAATMKEGTALRGHVLGRVLNSNSELFSAPFPASKEPSEAAGVAVGPFDRIYAGGYRTFGGVPEARVLHLHP